MELLRPAGAVFRWRDSRRVVRLAFLAKRKEEKEKGRRKSRVERASERRDPPRGGFPSSDYRLIKSP